MAFDNYKIIDKNAGASFDDVKHILYSGVKYVVFDLEGQADDSQYKKLYDYSKERFPEKVFDSVDAAKAFDEKNAGGSLDAAAEAISFADFKLNSDGLIPCIAQDYKTGEVLMMAWMNEESYNKTLETGLMTYWSRSRSKLWTKGEESGHFQHMISLIIDCDKDTILAKVRQEGPACHTGNPTCFFTSIVEGEKSASIRNVLEDVYKVIADRKVNPKEGSYTNYLFDSGVDKILKKVGEEATEIVIAAKNPDNSEIKYEIADFLYHAMVLMAEKGVTWDEIADELARRE
ncbi:MAG: bifunctional phosphoribosyl-AMP cyclohydrolase/phosphoribosyl-ATP diphosphatase HisIE [Eubacterium sp.]|nr:bifunctional phosphoribosyl-AMP cyclohydrolase/phosphoribosyl-ATP diphosphatase HisIE [Eubacterium sp.]